MTIPIQIPAEHDDADADTDTDTDINAGRRKGYSFDRQHAENSVTFYYPANLLGPTWLAGYAANKYYLYFVKIVHRIDRNV